MTTPTTPTLVGLKFPPFSETPANPKMIYTARPIRGSKKVNIFSHFGKERHVMAVDNERRGDWITAALSRYVRLTVERDRVGVEQFTSTLDGFVTDDEATAQTWTHELARLVGYYLINSHIKKGI